MPNKCTGKREQEENILPIEELNLTEEVECEDEQLREDLKILDEIKIRFVDFVNQINLYSSTSKVGMFIAKHVVKDQNSLIQYRSHILRHFKVLTGEKNKNTITFTEVLKEFNNEDEMKNFLKNFLILLQNQCHKCPDTYTGTERVLFGLAFEFAKSTSNAHIENLTKVINDFLKQNCLLTFTQPPKNSFQNLIF